MSALAPRLPVLLLALGLAACSSSHKLSVGSQGTVLHRESGPGPDEGSVYKVLPGRFGAPQIQRTSTRRVELPVLGLRARDLEADVAAALGAPPWRGVLVEQVEPDSAARAAGLTMGDVLVEAAGERVHSRAQLDELVRTRMRPGEPVVFVVERWVTAREPATRERVELTLVPGAREVLDDVSESFQLETAPGVQRLTGLQLGAVPASLAAEIWKRSADVVLVTGVIAGTPAYDAGLRSGDRVERVDGRPVRALDDVVAAVAARARARDLPLAADELPRAAGASAEVTDEPVEFLVDGPLGAHEARVAVRGDLDGEVSFSVPILFDYHGDVAHVRWSFLDFIFQFGASYRSTAVGSDTREPAVTSLLSLLPFGMFEFESGPRSRRTTLFWFVSWRSRR